MDDLDRGAIHFEDALTFCGMAGYRPELAWTCCDYIDTLQKRDGAGDRAKAVTLLAERFPLASQETPLNDGPRMPQFAATNTANPCFRCSSTLLRLPV